MVTTMLAPSGTTDHPPTDELVWALYENDWKIMMVVGVTAVLARADGSLTPITVVADPEGDRIAEIYVDNRQVSFRWALDYVRGEAG